MDWFWQFAIVLGIGLAIGYLAGDVYAVNKYLREYNAEVDEFNAGFAAYVDGKSTWDEIYYHASGGLSSRDVWLIGWWWAAMNDLPDDFRNGNMTPADIRALFNKEAEVV